ncbi:rhomboid family intramembrane serine protease [Pontibacter sp. H259]|uniref:rhomboid family intramembrane serine protease n=1 Tax=Pontibacter sp. H259 TaxID=3133421 RepID=UPI0030C25595
MSTTQTGLLYGTEQESSRFAFSFLPGLLFVLLLWLIHLLAYLTHADLAFLGVFPRNILGLVGVVLSPLIHADLKHLFSNSFPLILLSGFILFILRRQGLQVLVMAYVLSGLFTWFIGRQAHHIGASGVVYAMAGFLLFRGIITRDRSAMAVAFAVLFLYSGLFYGLFPKEERVSWEGHLAGMVAGLVAAVWVGQNQLRKKRAATKNVTVQAGVTQRHVSSTFIPYYLHYTLQYTLDSPDAAKTPFVYTLTPDQPLDKKQTMLQYTSSLKKQNLMQQHDRDTKR